MVVGIDRMDGCDRSLAALHLAALNFWERWSLESTVNRIMPSSSCLNKIVSLIVHRL